MFHPQRVIIRAVTGRDVHEPGSCIGGYEVGGKDSPGSVQKRMFIRQLAQHFAFNARSIQRVRLMTRDRSDYGDFVSCLSEDEALSSSLNYEIIHARVKRD